jgi:hypothetical protein
VRPDPFDLGRNVIQGVAMGQGDTAGPGIDFRIRPTEFEFQVSQRSDLAPYGIAWTRIASLVRLAGSEEREGEKDRQKA